MITSGYGRSDSADGGVFKWNFPLIGHYWVAGDTVLQHIAKKEGGWEKLRGKKIGVAISTAAVAHAELMIFGALIVFFLIVEPHGLARLWSIGKEKLRLWPFPH